MSHIDVSADLKGSQFSRFGCEPESLPVVAEDTNVAAAVEDKQSRLRAFSRPERLVQERFSRAVLWFSKMSSEARGVKNQRHPYQCLVGFYDDKSM